MTKIGNALILYNSNGFKEAFESLKKHYSNYLSNDEQALLCNLDKVIEAKNTAMQTAVDVLDRAGVISVNMEILRRGSSCRMSKSHIVERDVTGKIMTGSSLFGLTSDISNFQNVVALVADENTYDSCWSYSYIKKAIADATSSMKSDYRHFVAMKKPVLEVYQKYFDVSKVIDLGALVAEDKAARKAARKSAFSGDKVEAGDAKIVRYITNNMGFWENCSYNEFKEALKAMTDVIPVVCIRDKSTAGNRDYYADFAVPTDKTSEKTFTIGDIRVKSLRDGLRNIVRRLGCDDKYVYLEVSPSAYKRLKLWRDTDLISEKDALIQLVSGYVENIPEVTIHQYTDNLLKGDASDLCNLKESFEKFTSDADKNTKFYKRLMMAIGTIENDRKTLKSPEYNLCDTLAFRDIFSTFNIKSPITAKTVTPEVFADYPMLKYFSADYGNNIRISGYESDKKTIRDIMDYVATIENK